MDRIDNATVLVTGGSKGIGLAIAEEFARHGHDLILVARGEEELQRVVRKIKSQDKVNVTYFAMDLSRQNAPEQLYENINQQGLTVDVLVNNAGYGMTGDFSGADYSRVSNLLQLNIVSLSQLTHLFVQPMLDRGYGRIMNVGSVTAYFAGGPNWSAYVASKHFVRAFSRGLSWELRGTGVAATLLSPGATATDFVDTAGAGNMLVYHMPGKLGVERIAKVAYRACQSGRASAIPGLQNKIFAFLGELHPRKIAYWVFTFLSSYQVKHD
jgi:short-subunit dehydrogenase